MSASPAYLREACARIHTALGTLPIHRDPGEVTFTNGLYFFYEVGEFANHAPAGRVVRVGNHPRSANRLIDRLREHYGADKNRSVFRKFLGGAMIRRDDPSSACLAPGPGRGHWEAGDGNACALCQHVEQDVSRYLSDAVSFRCVRIDDMGLRNKLEERLIATLAACPDCAPSAAWLGSFSYSATVRSCGLWNVQSVGGASVTDGDLRLFEDLVAATRANANPPSPDPLARTLIVIPCSGRKRPGPGGAAGSVSVLDSLDDELRARLIAGRHRMAPIAGLDESALRVARERYAGHLYQAAGDALEDAHVRDLHVLILSAGYGIVALDEPIGVYDRELRTEDWEVGLLGECLVAYARRHQLESVVALAGGSTAYADVIRGAPWGRSGAGASSVTLLAPRHPPAVNARRETPRAIGAALRALVDTGDIASDWRGPVGSRLSAQNLHGAGVVRSPTSSAGRTAPVIIEPSRSSGDETSEAIWRRISAFAGAEGFATQRALPVIYRVENDHVIVEGRRNAKIPRLHFERALACMPLRAVADVPKACWGASYIFAILSDSRICDARDQSPR